MTTYLDTDYRDTGAGDLVNYISREGDTPVHDRSGRPMSDERKGRFVEKSGRHQFERHMIISPENGTDLSNDELGKETRRTMERFTEDRPTATYAYSIHRDTEHPHAHVAMTGEKTDLYMDREDIENVREMANERMVERERYKHRQNERERREREQEKQLEEERERANERGGIGR
ncbi:relaxase/mobilization nuclease domain-containing protein [Halalkalicoccus subterraneus]|uniref:relaxase/mobilization nuclease domain-containing protein n=1 Tax=Halalkalicoccus subterraneus TaxID=2675002 RepID=UPI000EFB06CC|nr:relaxase/mobilization nuclease domain-containing protein [Halalkalicoccus subterraneus]